jgi:D-alanyl-D-alanine dipeptidase
MLCELMVNHPDFRRLDDVSGIVIDLRYVGDDNFVGRDLYGELDCRWLHVEAAIALSESVAILRANHPGYKLVVLDALRPHRIQEMLWQHLEGTKLRSYIADPARGSIHSFGMAVDVTILDEAGKELDMGTAFDALVEKSHPKQEAQFLADGSLTQKQFENRQILRQAMFGAGFRGINSEWWHFNFGDPDVVRQTYLRID